MKTHDQPIQTAGLLLVLLLSLPPTLLGAETAVQAWVRHYTGPLTNETAVAVAVDGSNDVIVTGYSYGRGSSSDYVTIK